MKGSPKHDDDIREVRLKKPTRDEKGGAAVRNLMKIHRVEFCLKNIKTVMGILPGWGKIRRSDFFGKRPHTEIKHYNLSKNSILF